VPAAFHGLPDTGEEVIPRLEGDRASAGGNLRADRTAIDRNAGRTPFPGALKPSLRVNKEKGKRLQRKMIRNPQELGHGASAEGIEAKGLRNERAGMGTAGFEKLRI